MHLIHGFYHRQENFLCPIPCHGPGLFQPTFQGLPFYEIHDDISGAVVLKYLMDAHYLWNPGNLFHLPGFPEKRFFSLLLGNRRLLGSIPLDAAAYRIGPADLPGGKILLDRDLPFGGKIPADVGDSKSALSQRLTDYIPALENHSRREKEVLGFFRLRVVTAMGAGVGFCWFHTLIAADKFHIPHSSFLY